MCCRVCAYKCVRLLYIITYRRSPLFHWPSCSCIKDIYNMAPLTTLSQYLCVQFVCSAIPLHFFTRYGSRSRATCKVKLYHVHTSRAICIYNMAHSRTLTQSLCLQLVSSATAYALLCMLQESLLRDLRSQDCLVRFALPPASPTALGARRTVTACANSLSPLQLLRFGTGGVCFDGLPDRHF